MLWDAAAEKIVTVAWPAWDDGRSMLDAFTAGMTRAQTEEWEPTSKCARELLAIALFEAMAHRAAREGLGRPKATDEENHYLDVIEATWPELATRAGYNVNRPAPTAENDAQANAIVLVGLVVVGIVWIVVLTILIVKGAELIKQGLLIHAQDRELMRAHEEAERVMAEHKKREITAGHSIPFTDEERAVFDRLERLQSGLTAEVKEATKPDQGLALGIGLGGLAAIGAILYLVFAQKKL